MIATFVALILHHQMWEYFCCTIDSFLVKLLNCKSFDVYCEFYAKK